MAAIQGSGVAVVSDSNAGFEHSHPWLHAYAVFVAFATLFPIIAGALVTSNDAGLSVPDWPTSFGTFRMPRMVGGVLYEHGHRMIAATVGLLTLILALWVWWKEPRRWARWLALAAVLAVVAQGVLGGITVLFYLPVAISTGHATLAQTFFCIMVTLALTIQRDWRWNEPSKLADETGMISSWQLALATTGAIYLQLILGAIFRHNGIGIAPHLAGAVLVAALATWLGTRVFAKFPTNRPLTRWMMALMGLLAFQIFLGISAYILKIQFRDAPQPMPVFVRATTAHVAVGALLLASSLILTLQIYRRVAGPGASSDSRGIRATQKAAA
ncbi:MAG: COX15/CtaA family protein [Terriglobia bacterium]